jgi:hypothetical protein
MNRTRLMKSISKLDRWIVANDYKGYDPFDGLSTPVADFLTGKNHYLRIVLQQSVRRFPLNLRPLLGIKKATSSKGMGFCALGYLRLYQATGQEAYRHKAESCLQWLIRHPSQGYAGYAWGNHFNYESRAGKIPKGLPTIVWTALIADVFLEAFELLHQPEYLAVAQSCGRFIMNDIGRYQHADGRLCFMYTPPLNGDRPSWDGCIHNSNVLGARVLARLYRHGGGTAPRQTAKQSVQFTVDHQLPEGGWYYGEPKKYRWIDSFHTGYVLESIRGYINAAEDDSFSACLRKGYDYFVNNFFDPDGTPRYYNTKTYPIDIQCASQAIQTLINLRDYHPDSLNLAQKVAQWTIDHLQDEKGYFYFRKYPLVTNKTPTFHWGQATMLSALAHLHHALD